MNKFMNILAPLQVRLDEYRRDVAPVKRINKRRHEFVASLDEAFASEARHVWRELQLIDIINEYRDATKLNSAMAVYVAHAVRRAKIASSAWRSFSNLVSNIRLLKESRGGGSLRGIFDWWRREQMDMPAIIGDVITAVQERRQEIMAMREVGMHVDQLAHEDREEDVLVL